MTAAPKQMEVWATFISKKFAPLIFSIATLLVASVAVDVNYGLIGNLPGEMPKTIGKFYGEIGLTIAEVTIAYYIIRESYVWIKKKGVALPLMVDGGIKSLLNITRMIHPFAGFLAICLIIMHGYIMTFAWLTAKGIWAIWSGAAALGVLVLLGFLGWYIRANQPALLIRRYHRYMGFLFFVLYFLHKGIAD